MYVNYSLMTHGYKRHHDPYITTCSVFSKDRHTTTVPVGVKCLLGYLRITQIDHRGPVTQINHRGLVHRTFLSSVLRPSRPKRWRYSRKEVHIHRVPSPWTRVWTGPRRRGRAWGDYPFILTIELFSDRRLPRNLCFGYTEGKRVRTRESENRIGNGVVVEMLLKSPLEGRQLGKCKRISRSTESEGTGVFGYSSHITNRGKMSRLMEPRSSPRP